MPSVQTATNTYMDPTIKFRLSIPFALFSPSPPLAALHASRAHLLHPHIPTTHNPSCSRCGSLLIQRSLTSINKKSSRIHRRSCRICGATTPSSFPTAPFPPTRRQGPLLSQPPPTMAHPIPQTISPSPPKPQPAVASKSRQKKRSGLQHLLALNRENEEKERQKQKQNNSSQLGGLAAFLSDL